jgi:hypothetical protein
MKIQSVFSRLPKLFPTLALIVFLSSCSSYTQQVDSNNDKQMGERIQSRLSNQTTLSESQIAKAIYSLATAKGSNELSAEQINTTVKLYREGLISTVVNNDFEGLLLLNKDSQPVKNNKIQTLFTLFPNNADSIASNLTKYGVYEVDELLEVLLTSNLDPSIILQASASGETPDIMSIGWGGSGAFSSVVEYNGDTYASSDVTGVWKYNGYGWDPLVNGLPNYNITGLLVHGDSLLAATKSQILKLEANSRWSSIGLELKTYRNTTLQLYSTSSSGVTCFAALQPSLGCIDKDGNVSKTPLSISNLKGVFFDKSDDYLFGFNGKKLYRISTSDGSKTLEYTFPTNILRIEKLDESLGAFVFTQKGIFELDTFASITVDLKNKSILNVLKDTTSEGNHLIALGSTWNSGLYQLTSTHEGLTIREKVSISFDSSLPFRQWRKAMTKPLGMPRSVLGKIWFSDYRGIYSYDVNTNKIYEKSKDASNFVGTDIHIDADKLYIASMDNGLVSMPLETPNKFTQIFPRRGSDWLLAGHTWSVDSNEQGVFATLSPWNLAQDYLLTADKENNFLNVQQIDNSTNRSNPEAFWSQSYSRKLLVDEEILVYKDGSIGGLFKLKYTPRQNNNDIQETTSKKIFSTSNNRVYRALLKTDKYIVSYHIDDVQKLYFNDIETKALVKTVNAPSGLWAFNMEYIDDEIYIIGARGNAVVYKYNESENDFIEILNEPSSSAFLSFNKAPNRLLTIAGAVSWGGSSSGKVLMNKQHSDTWIDMTCLLGNESGVVDTEFSSDGRFVYLLQKVGSITRIKTALLSSFEGCKD